MRGRMSPRQPFWKSAPRASRSPRIAAHAGVRHRSARLSPRRARRSRCATVRWSTTDESTRADVRSGSAARYRRIHRRERQRVRVARFLRAVAARHAPEKGRCCTAAIPSDISVVPLPLTGTVTTATIWLKSRRLRHFEAIADAARAGDAPLVTLKSGLFVLIGRTARSRPANVDHHRRHDVEAETARVRPGVRAVRRRVLRQ